MRTHLGFPGEAVHPPRSLLARSGGSAQRCTSKPPGWGGKPGGSGCQPAEGDRRLTQPRAGPARTVVAWRYRGLWVLCRHPLPSSPQPPMGWPSCHPHCRRGSQGRPLETGAIRAGVASMSAHVNCHGAGHCCFPHPEMRRLQPREARNLPKVTQLVKG